ncbi:prepilin-type N-terminal cleavage/methylation domain-containing protein [Stutzerimonas stutzeri]|uniref:type IV pilus modification PilV family protein n=1 Tax=Stutzerimonas stutzeri TaxID=316 RepID=UPI003718ED7B
MKRQRGMTLVELVITIVVVGIAAAALFSAMATITARSADPMLRQQSLMLAEAYLEEILAQAYAAPDAMAACGRACFNDVSDYDGLNDKPPRDALDNILTRLPEYRVKVRVINATLADGAATVPARYVEVRVTDPAGQELILGGYRGNY